VLPLATRRPRSIFPGTGAVHFSTRGEYGVRLMVELARHYGDGPVSLAEMADHEELPRAYLEQLVVSLREEGLVQSTRGAHGGYQLAKAPAEIRMGTILRALEGKVRTAISDALDSMTLADLAVPRARHPYHAPATTSELPATTISD